MRPLVARCRLGLGSMFRCGGRALEAVEYLTAAGALFREMGMTWWLECAGAERDLVTRAS